MGSLTPESSRYRFSSCGNSIPRAGDTQGDPALHTFASVRRKEGRIPSLFSARILPPIIIIIATLIMIMLVIVVILILIRIMLLPVPVPIPIPITPTMVAAAIPIMLMIMVLTVARVDLSGLDRPSSMWLRHWLHGFVF